MFSEGFYCFSASMTRMGKALSKQHTGTESDISQIQEIAYLRSAFGTQFDDVEARSCCTICKVCCAIPSSSSVGMTSTLI